MQFLTAAEVFALADEVANPPGPSSQPLRTYPQYGCWSGSPPSPACERARSEGSV